MKRVLLAIAATLTLGLAYRFRCLGKHTPKRQPLGYRCAVCKHALGDFERAWKTERAQ